MDLEAGHHDVFLTILRDGMLRWMEAPPPPFTVADHQAGARPAALDSLLCEFTAAMARCLRQPGLWCAILAEPRVHVASAFARTADGRRWVALAMADVDASRRLDLIKRPGSVLDSPPLRYERFGHGDSVWAVRLSSLNDADQSVAVGYDETVQAGPGWRWFVASTDALRLSFAAFASRLAGMRVVLEAAAEGARCAARLDLSQRAHELRATRTEVAERLGDLESAVRSAIAVGDPESEIVALEVLTWAVQRTLGRGWPVQSLATNARLRDRAAGERGVGPVESRSQQETLATLLQELINRASPTSHDDDGAVPSLTAPDRMSPAGPCLRDVARTLTGVVAPQAILTDPGACTGIGSQLALWTAIHQAQRPTAGRRRVAPQDQLQAEAAWKGVIGAAEEGLAGMLLATADAIRTVDGELEPSNQLGRGRTWILLWFCLECLRTYEGKDREHDGRSRPPPLPPEASQLRTHLAYVVRECLRFQLLGDRDDYFFQPAALAHALRTVVEYHAHHVLGVSSDIDVKRLLKDLGEDRGVTGTIDPSEHLQHVLDTYTLGHFLLSIHVTGTRAALHGNEGGCAMSALLTSRSGFAPDAEAIRETCEAHALAALFHDVGHLLIGPDIAVHRSLARLDPQLSASLDDATHRVNALNATLAATCVAEVRAVAGIDPGRDADLEIWLSQQGASTRPSHALVAAWYLARVCSQAGELPASVRRTSVRAVLLHDPSSGRIDADVDPVAALLVACNEVMEWDPDRPPSPAPNDLARAFQVMATLRHPNEPRIQRLAIAHLGVDQAPDGRVRVSLDLDVMGGEEWPLVLAELQPPDRLDLPAHAIWPLKAQSLARIRPSSAGWAPRMKLTGRVPSPMRRRELTTRSLLQMVTHHASLPNRADLQRWLAVDDLFRSEGELEWVMLRSRLGQPWHHDVRRWMPDLLLAADEQLWATPERDDGPQARSS